MPIFNTLTDIATHYGVSRRAVEAWRQRDDWPDRQQDGSLSGDDVEAFLQRHALGPHNRRRQSGDISDALREATIAKLFEQSENERIRKERATVEQAAELGGIVHSADVAGYTASMREVVTAVHDQLIADVMAALPPEKPADWLAARERVMELAKGLPQRVFEAVMEAGRGES